MKQIIDLTGKKIIVVGASQGIGQQTAITLSTVGAELILIARNADNLNKTKSLLSGEGHICKPFDIGQIDEIEPLIKGIVKESGKIDGLVYCAGITNDRPLTMFKPELVEEVLRVNLCGFIEMVRAATKKNRFNEGMRIVGISSTSALKGAKAHMAYSASKAGMDGAVRAMAVELAEKGICINTVAPGMIHTSMYEKYLEGNGGAEGSANLGLLGRQYLGIGRTEDVANTIAFLISPASRFITGVTLPVDGGLTSC